MIIIRILLIIVRRRRRRRRAVAPTSNTASHDYHEKISWRVSIAMGLRLAALRAAGAPLKIGVSISYAKYLKNNFLLLPVFKTFLSSQFTFRTSCGDYFNIQQELTNTNEDLAVTARKKNPIITWQICKICKIRKLRGWRSNYKTNW